MINPLMFAFRKAATMAAITKNAHDNIEREFIDTFVTEAKVRAPYDVGNLKRSIVPKKIASLGWEVMTTTQAITGTGYGAYVELGTRKMKAQPFFAPAYVAARKELESGWHRI